MMEFMNFVFEFGAVFLVFGAITWVWTGQSISGSNDKVIGATDKMSWFGAAFNDPVITGAQAESCHTENAAKAEQCDGGTDHMHCHEFLTTSTSDLDGGGSAALSTYANGDMNLNIVFDDDAGDRETFDGTFTIYGASTGVGPTDISADAFEQGDTNWIEDLDGTAKVVDLADQVSAGTQTFYIGIAISPDTVGEKNTEFTMRIGLTYA